MNDRKPMALTNWKMAMTVSECEAFLHEFMALTGDVLESVDVVVCPPYTAIRAMKQCLGDGPVELGAQNMAAMTDSARTGEISASLLIDVGCRWVMLGHREVRRHLGDCDAGVQSKVRVALEAGLRPILFVGEAVREGLRNDDALKNRLSCLLDGCSPDEIATMAFVYEPEDAIGVSATAPPDPVSTGCSVIRTWLRRQRGDEVADRVRIIYGGSVSPDRAPELLGSPDVDGLAATRRGRNPASFAQIVRQIERSKCP